MTQDQAGSETSRTEVVDAVERNRFEISVDGKRAGLAAYHLGPDRITFVHTEIDDAYAGKGLAGVLVRAALDSARERGLSVIPRCPYVRSWIAKHPDYVDLVPAARRAEFELA
jgi:predicted GNAT family acetyltransferase